MAHGAFIQGTSKLPRTNICFKATVGDADTSRIRVQTRSRPSQLAGDCEHSSEAKDVTSWATSISFVFVPLQGLGKVDPLIGGDVKPQ